MDAYIDPRTNFLLMSILFSICHGFCTTPIIYGSALLGIRIGDIGNGVLYIMNIVCAMFISTPLVLKLSIKTSLLFAMFSLCFYEGFFAIAVSLNKNNSLWLSIIGALCGGFALSVAFVAQGSYMSHSATLVAEAEKIPREVATLELANTLGFWHVVFEIVPRSIFSSLLEAQLAPPLISLIFICISLIAMGATRQINPILIDSSPISATVFKTPPKSILLWRNPHIWLLSATNFTFGFSGAIMNGYVNKFARTDLVGYMTAVTAASAAIFIVVYRPLVRLCGKGACLAVGSASFLSISMVLLATKGKQSWGVEIVVLYLLQGSGRAVWESTNKAVFADAFLGDEIEGAFANCNFQLATGSAIGFFWQARDPQGHTLLIIVLVLASSILPLYTASVFSQANVSEKMPLNSQQRLPP